ncbi:MAG: GldG family protein, partial [Planctomycetes bacterium]|nr:GldG family protein [Planctomycetota bacterium]
CLASALLTGLLVALNLVVANLILRKADHRLDLTEDKRYEIGGSTERIVERLQDTVNIKCYVSSDLPKSLSHCERILVEKLQEYERMMADRDDASILFTFSDPSTDDEAKQECEDMGIASQAIADFEDSTTQTVRNCWLATVLRYGDRKVVYNFLTDMPADTYSDPRKFSSDLEFVLTRAIRNVSTERKTVALLSDIQMVPVNPRDPRSETQPYQGLYYLSQALERTHDVVKLDLKEVNKGKSIPGDTDVVVLHRPQEVTDIGRYILDQYLVGGGNLLCMIDQGIVEFAPKPKQGQVGNVRLQDYDLPTYEPTIFEHGMGDMLASYGLRLERAFIQDFNGYEAPYYLSKDVAMHPLTRQPYIVLNKDFAPYPSWPVIPERDDEGAIVDPEQLGDRFRLLSPNDSLTLVWCSPITILEDRLASHEARADVVLRSGPRSYIEEIEGRSFSADPAHHRGAEGQELRSFPVAAMVRGRFRSFFAGKDLPAFEGPDAESRAEDLAKSRRDAAAEVGSLMVVGDADFCLDSLLKGLQDIEIERAQKRNQVAELTREKIAAKVRPTLFFVSNCIDVMAFGEEATDLFDLQQRTFRSRAIRSVAKDPELKSRIQLTNLVYLPGAALLLMVLVLGFRWARGMADDSKGNQS